MSIGLSINIVHPLAKCIVVGTSDPLSIRFSEYKSDMITITFVDNANGNVPAREVLAILSIHKMK